MGNLWRRLRPAAQSGLDWPRIFDQLEAAAQTSPLKDFYARRPVPGQTPLSQVPFVALDLETTGTNPDTSSIVSIGLVPFTLDRIQCARAGYWLIKPRRALAESSIRIHGITHADLERAPDFSEVLGEVLEALAGRVVVVHYRGIERPFLRRAVRERTGDRLEFPIVDTMEIEARIHRGWKTSPPARFVAGMFGRQPPSIRLAQSRNRYHLPLYGAHHALSDALASAELLQAQVAHHFSPKTRIDRLWC